MSDEITPERMREEAQIVSNGGPVGSWTRFHGAAKCLEAGARALERCAELERQIEAMLCEGCPPAGYPTDDTRCRHCPRRQQPGDAGKEG